jgi:heme A synthase
VLTAALDLGNLSNTHRSSGNGLLTASSSLHRQILAYKFHDELQQFFFGTIGVLLTIALYWIFFRQIRRADPSHLKTLAASLLLFALIRGLTDTQNFDLSFPLWLMTMLSILFAAQASVAHQHSVLRTENRQRRTENYHL